MIDNSSPKHPATAKRSSHWPKIRKEFIAKNPICAMCGGDKKLEVHHVHAFHLHPDLELDPTNLITLCENDKNGVNCHLLFGHLGNFKSFNLNVHADAIEWNSKIHNRPLSETEEETKKAA